MKTTGHLKRRALSLLLAAAFCAALLPRAAVPARAAGVSAAAALSRSIPYHGDPGRCRMTAEQAETYVEVLESEIAAAWNEYNENEWWIIEYEPPFNCYAALIDFGDGVPALYFVGGAVLEWYHENTLQYNWINVVRYGLWEYKN